MSINLSSPWLTLHNLKNWIRHRTWDRYHIVKLRDVAPGYLEPEDRMFLSMMQILCDYVECELPHHDWACNQGSKKKPATRDREGGLAYLDWEIGLRMDETCGVDPDQPHYGARSSQSIAASEVKEIYLWYRDTYLNRDDPWTNQPVDGDKAMALDERRYEEDARYMKRLVDVRRSMWT